MEAVSAGHYQFVNFGAFGKIQILTIEGLLNSTESPRYPDLSRGSIGSKKAKVEKAQVEQGELLEVLTSGTKGEDGGRFV